MAEIFRDVPFLPDDKVGRIDADGRVYWLDDDQEQAIGTVDYGEKLVLDEDDFIVGWADEEGFVYVADEVFEEDVDEEGGIELTGDRIGRVDPKDGKLYLYLDEGDDEEYVGSLQGMKDPVEGAAALLFFFGEEDDLDEE